MTRPAIVIGLGGTGQWILTFLKKDLLEIGNGQMPPGVRLLCFDTTTSSTAKVGQTDEGRQTETEIKLGSVKLEHGIEFIPIGANVYDLAQEIRKGQDNPELQQHPHIASWFDAADMLKRHSRSTFNLAEGAGQVRQFGRMAIFSDLLQGPMSKVRAHIRQAVSDLRKEVTETRQMEIIIVASFAGGTGAGMFIDTAILARRIASEQVQKALCVRGFYVLPRVFTSQDTNMQARAFAAWRELDRFLMIGEKFGQRKMVYHPRDPQLQIDINERIFDVCYLVDAVSQGLNSMENLSPDRALFPMVSDTISTILDTKAGQIYTEYITSNLAGRLDMLPRAPYHSAIGAYTVKVPVYYALQVFVHQYGLDILDRLLRPVKDVEEQRVIGVSTVANEEKPNSSARKGAIGFLTARSSTDFGLVGDERANTSFTHVVADINNKEAATDHALIQRVAMMNLAASARAGEAGNYFNALVNIGEDEKGKKLLKEVQEELYLPLMRAVPPSRIAKDTPSAAFPRIKGKSQDFISEHYGQKLTDGTDRRGKFGDALFKCHEYQIERFREMLYLWLGATLNGTSNDPEVSKGGKIGYAQDALVEISNALGYFIKYLSEVRQERTTQLTRLNLERMSTNALNQYQSHKDKRCWLTAWDSFVHPRAHMKQLAYLRTVQVLIDHRKYDILLNVLMETADHMRDITDQTRSELDIWIDYLATGDTERQIDGLYGSLQNSLDLAKANHYDELLREKVQQIIGDIAYETDPHKVKELLGRFEWKIKFDSHSKIRLGLTVSVPKPDNTYEVKEFRRAGEDAAQFNLRTILALGEAQFADVPEQAPIAKILMEKYASSAALADAVDKRSEPMYEKSTQHSDPKLVSCFIRIDTDSMEQGRQEAKTYLKAFETRLSQLNPFTVESEFQLLPSDNKYRMTLMRSDDLLLSDGFALWNICKDSYEKKIIHERVPAERFHVYPAERNAAFYEQEIYSVLKKSSGYRTLHPSVVALLEDRSWFEYFFLCLAYGFICKERVRTQDVYTLEVPGESEKYNLSRVFDDVQLQRPPDWLEIIDVFVNRRAAVDNSQHWIDLNQVKAIVQERVQEIDVFGAKERLQFQLDNPAGVVMVLRDKVEKERRLVHPTEKQFIAVEYEDLADLATVILRRSIANLGDSY
jgi:hypothetical protein